MSEQEKQPDVRDSAIYANGLYAVGPHRKIVSSNSLVAVLKSKELEAQYYPTFLDLLEGEDGIETLKRMFNAIAQGAKANGSNSEIFWLVNATDDRVTDKNTTYSQGSYPHAHIIHGPLPEDYKYEYILQEKTYTPLPRADFNEHLQSHLYSQDCTTPTGQKRYSIFNVPDDFAESPEHILIASPDFLNFMDFTARADELDYDVVRAALVAGAGALIGDGGARIVCDDFNSPGVFTLRIQGGDQEHKWFERPQPSL